jgi:tetratricopeptide (TPR) repeat protein
MKRLRKAVEIAPGFSAAWNHLGTIAYKAQQYDEAAADFRKALTADPEAYEPLVNLGGVLLNLSKTDEAWSYNVHAVLKRPEDALANSQLGMNYYELGKADLAIKHLEQARKLDPGHFSNPQLLLAEIYMRRQENARAAEVLEQFLAVHPDWPRAAAMREAIGRLRH